MKTILYLHAIGTLLMLLYVQTTIANGLGDWLYYTIIKPEALARTSEEIKKDIKKAYEEDANNRPIKYHHAKENEKIKHHQKKLGKVSILPMLYTLYHAPKSLAGSTPFAKNTQLLAGVLLCSYLSFRIGQMEGIKRKIRFNEYDK